jgi:hypothetical protein
MNKDGEDNWFDLMSSQMADYRRYQSAPSLADMATDSATDSATDTTPTLRSRLQLPLYAHRGFSTSLDNDITPSDDELSFGDSLSSLDQPSRQRLSFGDSLSSLDQPSVPRLMFTGSSMESSSYSPDQSPMSAPDGFSPFLPGGRHGHPDLVLYHSYPSPAVPHRVKRRAPQPPGLRPLSLAGGRSLRATYVAPSAPSTLGKKAGQEMNISQQITSRSMEALDQLAGEMKREFLNDIDTTPRSSPNPTGGKRRVGAALRHAAMQALRSPRVGRRNSRKKSKEQVLFAKVMDQIAAKVTWGVGLVPCDLDITDMDFEVRKT